MKEEKEKVIVMVPYPAQGHVTPMVNLAASLQGYRPIIVLPEFLRLQINSKGKMGRSDDHHHGVEIMWIPDGMEETHNSKAKPGFFEIEKSMENKMPPYLEGIIKEYGKGRGVACVVVDLLASWAIQVSNKCGVTVAAFWPAMLSTYLLIAAIPDLLQASLIDSSGIPMHNGEISVGHDLPTMNIQCLPWLIGSLPERQSKFKFWVRTMNRARSVPWLLVNSFLNETQNFKSSPPREGPTIYPIGLIQKHQQEQPTTPGLTFWDEDESCLDWLDKQKPNSVLYVSLGTWFSPTDKSKVTALATSLEALGRPFLWALGPKWADGLPVGFKDRLSGSGTGKVVAWAPQVKVLQHKGVACFLTHCGWNSISEAIRCKKCLVCYPLAGDQLLNCVYVVDVWKIGVRIQGFGAREMDDSVNRVMGDTQMKRRVENLYRNFMGDEARLTMKANLGDFLSQLNKSTN